MCIKGYKQTEDHKRKIGLALLGRTVSEEARKKISLSSIGKPGTMLGKHHSEEAKEKMRKACLGRPGSMLGKHHTEETRKKISDGNKGKQGFSGALNPMKRPEVREKNSASHRHPRGPYTKERILKVSSAPVTHHRDFDHSNDFSENKREMSRQEHNSLHRQSGRRAIVFAKNALEKGVVTKKFYEDFLAYINQEEQELSEEQKIVVEKTATMIN